VARGDGAKGIGMAGGKSWTSKWYGASALSVLFACNLCAAQRQLLFPSALFPSARSSLSAPPRPRLRRLSFDNEYFVKGAADPSLLHLETDACLTTDAGFKPHFEEFKDQATPAPDRPAGLTARHTHIAHYSALASHTARRPPPGPNFAQMDLQAKFFEAYASAHAKLSELGSKFEPAGGITL
jgi:hypothetical protein